MRGSTGQRGTWQERAWLPSVLLVVSVS
jgi:hypothetical protein